MGIIGTQAFANTMQGNGNSQSTGFSFDRMNVGAGQSTALVVGYWLCGDPINRLQVPWMRMTQWLFPFGTMVHLTFA